MKTRLHRFTAGAVAFALVADARRAARALRAGRGSRVRAPPSSAPQDRWPRKFTAGGNTIDLYTPQLDAWDGRTIEWHAAVSITAPGSEGADLRRRLLDGQDQRGQDHAPGRADEPRGHEGHLSVGAAAERRRTSRCSARRCWPKKTVTVALDKLEANLAILQEQKKGESAPLQNDPPKIVFSSVPAILVLVDGEPAWRPVEDTDLQRVINTSPIVLKDKSGALYLHLYDGWMQAAALDGPWAVATKPPASLEKALKQILDAKAGDPLTGGTPDDPDAEGRPAAHAEDRAHPGRLHRHLADRADRHRRRARLRADRRDAAALRQEHDRARLQEHRRPEDLRARLGPLVQRARARGAVGIRARSTACRRTLPRSPTTARWRT